MTEPTPVIPPVQHQRLLSLRNIVKSYARRGKQFVAVQGVDLTINEGEFVCLLGPSGCGKSTLLRIIAGLNKASAGSVFYRDLCIDGVNPFVTIVFQTFALYPWLTVQENVEVALKARNVPAAERTARALKLLDTVGLDGFESAYPRELSGGMRQKVGFARAMAVEPELLCLDEPFSALDVLSAEALRGELMELWLSKKIPTKAILMVTHNIEEAVLMADRIVVMAKNPGHIMSEIPITLRHPRHHKDTAFQAIVDKVYSAVAGHSKAEMDGTVVGHGKQLPHAHLSALTGLTEKLLEHSGKADLYRITGELNLELDDILPIVEMGNMLGFLLVFEGDLILTDLGKAYAEASILARKEMLASRVLRVPVITWMYETLKKEDEQRLPWEYFLDRFRNEYGDFGERQLDIAINWGRHSELFSYDDSTGELFLENESPTPRQ